MWPELNMQLSNVDFDFHPLRRHPYFATLLAAVWLVSFGTALGDKGDGIIDPGEDATAELARAVQNPVASLISVPFQNNTTFEWGPDEEALNVLNIRQSFRSR